MSGSNVDAIIDDITGRSGLGNSWEDIDTVIQRQIKQKWRSIIVEKINNK